MQNQKQSVTYLFKNERQDAGACAPVPMLPSGHTGSALYQIHWFRLHSVIGDITVLLADNQVMQPKSRGSMNFLLWLKIFEEAHTYFGSV